MYVWIGGYHVFVFIVLDVTLFLVFFFLQAAKNFLTISLFSKPQHMSLKLFTYVLLAYEICNKFARRLSLHLNFVSKLVLLSDH